MPVSAKRPMADFIAPRDLLTVDEIIRLTRVFVSLGVRKIRLTGGEPLLRADLPMIVSGISSSRSSVIGSAI